MAITVDASIGGVASNAFITVDEFDAYVSTRLNAGAGSPANPDDKAKAVLEATRELSLMAWGGTRATTTQRLSWPRAFALDPDSPIAYETQTVTGLVYYDYNVIPWRVKDATSELALQFLKAGSLDLAAVDPKIGVIEKTVDVITTKWADPAQRAQGLARFPRIFSLIGPLLDPGSNGGLSVVRV